MKRKYVKPKIEMYEIDLQTIIAVSSMNEHSSNEGSISSQNQIFSERKSVFDNDIWDNDLMDDNNN